MGKTVAFTSAAVNYLPKVRKLCASIRRYHPEFEIVLALADEKAAGVEFGAEPIDRVIAVDELPIPDRRRWIYFHTIVELATAIKPFVLCELLADPEVDRVLYFDPDMVLFSRLDDLLAALDGSNLVLTPHLTRPEATLEAVRDNEISALKHGVYNLGFLGVRPTPEGQRFARWWADRIYHFCVADIPGGLFTDQRWIDLAPAFFDGVGILKNPRFNVATWNITTRQVAGDLASGFTVDGEPLGFYHFTGFDSGAHKVMADKHGAGNPAVAALVAWYAHEARFDADEPAAQVAWRYGRYSDGTPIPLGHRRLYRARPDLQAAYPDPFDATGLLRWMNTQGAIEHPEFCAKKAHG
ncbi:glycosyl transferase [Vulcaniibacterium gelatinicum]|uniref:glycosyl transferase n=1 Tax=Vulcaniibacterium gelatinicum TaxID=2598725 RepID=UPI0011C8C579|nr:glycosyl transferase [Vulcaniibacterium gelatinicum]